jgi:hypothetical protein
MNGVPLRHDLSRIASRRDSVIQEVGTGTQGNLVIPSPSEVGQRSPRDAQ